MHDIIFYICLLMVPPFYRNQTSIDVAIVKNLTKMLDDLNVHAKSFRMARDGYKDHPYDDLKLRLIVDRKKKIGGITFLIVDTQFRPGKCICFVKKNNNKKNKKYIK